VGDHRAEIACRQTAMSSFLQAEQQPFHPGIGP
jgi:hypothetical protein